MENVWLKIAGAVVVVAVIGGVIALRLSGGSGVITPPPSEAGELQAEAPAAEEASAEPAPNDGARTIACAPAGAEAFADNCRMERREIDGVPHLAVFHPDGSFRRFEVKADGSGLVAVAGADSLSQSLDGDTLEITLVGNRYRFPVSDR